MYFTGQVELIMISQNYCKSYKTIVISYLSRQKVDN